MAGEVQYLRRSVSRMHAQALLARGAAVDAANAEGITALISSAFFGHEPVVVQLLQRGADAHTAARRNRRTALHWAAMNDHDTVCAGARPLVARMQPCMYAHALFMSTQQCMRFPCMPAASASRMHAGISAHDSCTAEHK